MKTNKKIWFSAALSVLLLAVSLGLSVPRHTYAAGNTAVKAQADQCFKSLTFVNIAEIDCTIKADPNGLPATTVVFRDEDPTDGQTSYALISPTNAFCNTDAKVYHVGGGVDGSDFGLDLSSVGKDTASTVNFGFITPNNNKAGCSPYPVDKNGNINADGGKVSRNVANPNNIGILLQGVSPTDKTQAGTITSLTGVTQGHSGKDLEGLKFTRYPGSDPANGWALFSDGFNAAPDQCSGRLLAVNNTGQYAQEYDIGKKGDAINAKNFPNLGKIASSACAVSQINFGIDNKTNSSFSISPAVNIPIPTATTNCTNGFQNAPTCTACSDGTTTLPCTSSTSSSGSSVDPNSSEACESDVSSALSWLICPVLVAVSNGADAFNTLIEQQLRFDINQNLPDDGQVSAAWTLVKNIASAMLVILLLVMVFSQAIGGGPFEAYTVKKMLPRIVIAIIAMQFSWVACKYLVGLANDAGDGLAQLLTVPFGGVDNLKLPNLISHLNPTWEVSGSAPIIVFFFFILATFPVESFIIVLMAAFAVFIAVIIALATLLFRNTLIILLTIFSPLALLAWIFPSQSLQKYWKMWSDNFTKLLLLFPMMMGLIYGGRIMAWVVGGAGYPGLLDFIIVLVGFFGPYFFLPKAFKWGGSILSGANQAVASNKQLGKFKEGTNKGLSGWLGRQRGARASAIHPDTDNLAFGRARIPRSRFIPSSLHDKKLPMIRASGKLPNRLVTGYLLPTKRNRNLTKKLGKSWSGERAEENEAFLDDFSRTLYRKGATKKQLSDFKSLLKTDALRANPNLSDKEADDLAQKRADTLFPENTRKGGVSSSKWGTQMLAYKAAIEGDQEMLKALARFHIQKKSLLEVTDSRFQMPEIDPKTGAISRSVPFMDWSIVQDQQIKEPDLYAGMSGLMADFAANNFPRGGALYRTQFKRAGFKWIPRLNHETGELTYEEDENFDPNGTYDLEWHKAMGGHTKFVGDKEVIADPEEKPLYRPYVIWHHMNQSEGAFKADFEHAGNRGNKSMDMVNDIAKGESYEDIAKDLKWATPTTVLPDGSMGYDIPVEAKLAGGHAVAEGAVEAILKSLETTGGLAKMEALSDYEIGTRFIQALRNTGRKTITDSAGKVHNVDDLKDGDDILRIAQDALHERQRGTPTGPAPTSPGPPTHGPGPVFRPDPIGGRSGANQAEYEAWQASQNRAPQESHLPTNTSGEVDLHPQHETPGPGVVISQEPDNKQELPTTNQNSVSNNASITNVTKNVTNVTQVQAATPIESERIHTDESGGRAPMNKIQEDRLLNTNREIVEGLRDVASGLKERGQEAPGGLEPPSVRPGDVIGPQGPPTV